MSLDPALKLALASAAALLFASTAVHKLRSPGAFRAALADYDLLPRRAVPFAVPVLAGLELLVAVGCLLPATSRAAALAGASLLAVYSAAIAINLARGNRAIDCGCGGPAGARPLGPGLLVRNTILVAALLLAALPAATRPWVWLDTVTVAGFVAVSGLLYAAAEVAASNAARLRSLEGAR